MKGKIIFWLVVIVCLFGLILSGCGGDGAFSPIQPPSSETETGKTAKVLLRINFGEERARGDALPLIKEAQRKKVSRVYGWFYGQKDYYFACDDNDECIIEKEIEPGQYYLWVAAEQELGDNVNPCVTFSFYEKNLEFREGVNEKTVLLKLEDWQPITITIPEGITPEPNEYGCFEIRGNSKSENSYYSCFDPLTASSLIGTLPLDATEINLRLNDKIYRIEPQRFLDALIFDEPISLADCQWKLATIAVMNVDIGGPNMVVANSRDVLALRFKIEAIGNDIPLSNIGIKMNGSESDVDSVELTVRESQGELFLAEEDTATNGRINFNISPLLKITAKTSRIFSVFVDIPLSAENGSKFSFSVESINGDPNFAFKEVGPEFTIARTGILSVKTDWNPPSAIVLAGSAGNNFLNINFSAEGEEFKIKSLTFQVSDGGYCGDIEGEYKDISDVSIYDGATKIAESWIGFSGKTFYFNTATTETIIPKNKDKALFTKVDMSTIDPEFDNAPGSASADVKIVLTKVEAIGTISNVLVVLYPDIESNTMILRTSRPIVEYSTPWDPMGAATILTNGYINLFNIRVAADSAGGDVLQNKVSLMFQMSDGVQISEIRILDQNGNILNYGSPVCEGDCSIGFSLNNPDFDTKGEESIKIPSGQNRTFFFWGVVSGVKTGDSIAITLLGDDACYPVGTVTEVCEESFVWSDNYRQTSLIDAPNHPQWYNGNLVPGLSEPTPYTISY